jgi:hypothetical protein
MANRTFQEKTHGLVKRKVVLYAVVSVGAAGAVTLQKRTFTATGATATAASSSLGAAPTSGVGYAYGDGGGIRSVARTGTGLWTITLSDSYQYLLGIAIRQTSNATGLMTAAGVGIVSGSTTPTTNTAPGNGGVLAIALNDWAGAAVDPASGDTLTLEIVLGDATEP